MTLPNKKHGFTLVELMIVIAIIAVLATIIMPKMSGARDKSKIEACKMNLKQIATAVNLYMNDNNGALPAAGSINAGFSLVTQGYMKNIPVCPGNPAATASYYGTPSTTYPGDYACYCLNTSQLWHPTLNINRPFLYLYHNYILN